MVETEEVTIFKKMGRQMNNNNNRSIFRSSLLYILIFGAIVIVGMFNGDQKGPIADISYTEFMQSPQYRRNQRY